MLEMVQPSPSCKLPSISPLWAVSRSPSLTQGFGFCLYRLLKRLFQFPPAHPHGWFVPTHLLLALLAGSWGKWAIAWPNTAFVTRVPTKHPFLLPENLVQMRKEKFGQISNSPVRAETSFSVHAVSWIYPRKIKDPGNLLCPSTHSVEQPWCLQCHKHCRW